MGLWVKGLFAKMERMEGLFAKESLKIKEEKMKFSMEYLVMGSLKY